jgi:hypothetical protein
MATPSAPLERWLPRGTLIAAFVVIAALADLWVAVRPDLKRVDDAGMRAAADAVRKVLRPGDVVVHSPLLSVAELQHLGDLNATPHRPPAKLEATRRVLLLDRRDHPMFGFGAPSEVIDLPETGGTLEIRVFAPQSTSDLVVFDLRESLRATTMRIERNGTITSRCTAPRTEGGYSCPGEPEWLYAAPRSLAIEGAESPCIWAHPTNNGAIVFEIPAQAAPAAGRRLVLALTAALTDEAVRLTGDGAPVRTEVFQAGVGKGMLNVPNRVGWQRTRISIDPGVPVELKVTTPRDGRRHHCINAEIFDMPASGDSK